MIEYQFCNYYILDMFDFEEAGININTIKYIINKMLKEEFPYINVKFSYDPEKLNLPILRKNEHLLFKIESNVRFIISTLVNNLTPNTFISATLKSVNKNVLVLKVELKDD